MTSPRSLMASSTAPISKVWLRVVLTPISILSKSMNTAIFNFWSDIQDSLAIQLRSNWRTLLVPVYRRRHDRCTIEGRSSTMTMYCTQNRSILAVCATLALYGSAVSAAEQKPEVQRLFQSGAYEQAVEAARDGDPASTFLAAQSLMKLDRNDCAVAELTRLRASDNAAWRLIGESGEAVVANDAGRAIDLARRAIEA